VDRNRTLQTLQVGLGNCRRAQIVLVWKRLCVSCPQRLLLRGMSNLGALVPSLLSLSPCHDSLAPNLLMTLPVLSVTFSQQVDRVLQTRPCARERDASSLRTRKIISLATTTLIFHGLAAPCACFFAVAAKWVVIVKTCRSNWKSRAALLRAIEGNKHMAGWARLKPGRFPALDSALSS